MLSSGLACGTAGDIGGCLVFTMPGVRRKRGLFSCRLFSGSSEPCEKFFSDAAEYTTDTRYH